MSYDSPRPDAVAHNVLLPAAEMGLLYRPIHLLVGPLPWSECLSPYTRDLTITLDQFAQRKTAAGQPLRDKPNHPLELEDWYYETAEHFLSEDAKRVNEKKQIEAQLGMMRLYSNYPQTLWVDSKRIDWEATDSRLSNLSQRLGEPNPVWLILHPNDFEECSALVQEMTQKLSRQLLSCTVEAGIAGSIEQTGTGNFYTYNIEPAGASPYQMATQTFAQTLGEPIPSTQAASQPQAPQKPKTGPLHRIKA